VTLVVDGRLTIPLYHGTSDLFYESIVAHGLGGRNIIKEMRAVELLGYLISICRDSLPYDEEWLVRMNVAERIVRQGVTSGGFNLRHGSAYLTPSSFTAMNYATSNQYGSEALEYVMQLWYRLRERDISVPRVVSDIAQPLIEFTARPRIPILIKLEAVPANILAAENGGDAANILQRLEEWREQMDDRLFFTMCQQENFELLKPVPMGEAEVFQIVTSREHQLSLEPYGAVTSYRRLVGN